MKKARTPVRLRILAAALAAAVLHPAPFCQAAGGPAALGALAGDGLGGFQSFQPGNAAGGQVTGGYTAFGLMANSTLAAFARTNASNYADSLTPAFNSLATNIAMQGLHLQTAMGQIRDGLNAMNASFIETAKGVTKVLSASLNRKDFDPYKKQNPCVAAVYGYNGLAAGSAKKAWEGTTAETLSIIAGDKAGSETWTMLQEKTMMVTQQMNKDGMKGFGAGYLTGVMDTDESRNRMLAEINASMYPLLPESKTVGSGRAVKRKTWAWTRAMQRGVQRDVLSNLASDNIAQTGYRNAAAEIAKDAGATLGGIYGEGGNGTAGDFARAGLDWMGSPERTASVIETGEGGVSGYLAVASAMEVKNAVDMADRQRHQISALSVLAGHGNARHAADSAKLWMTD